jgi:hypothetical protein
MPPVLSLHPPACLPACSWQDLSRINAYFIEKEEDAVIRLRALEDRLAAAAGEGGCRGAALSPGEAEALRNQVGRRLLSWIG